MADATSRASPRPSTSPARPPASAADGRVTGRRLALALGAAVVLGLAAGLATPPLLRAVAPSWAQIERLSAVIAAEAYLAVIVGHLLAFGGLGGVRERLRLTRTTVAGVALAVVAWLAALVAAGLVVLALDPLLGWRDELGRALLFIGSDGGRLAAAGPALFVVATARAVVLAPLAEELLFRGSLFGWLRLRLGAAATIVLTAALFAAIHLMPVLLPLGFASGLAAGWVRERTASTTPILLVHVLNNVGLVIAAGLVAGWEAGPLA